VKISNITKSGIVGKSIIDEEHANPTIPKNSIPKYAEKRADAIMDLVDALTVAGHVDSPVALSE
jgi:hypothetical protein